MSEHCPLNPKLVLNIGNLSLFFQIRKILAIFKKIKQFKYSLSKTSILFIIKSLLNFLNFVDPIILYGTLGVNFDQNNVMGIINGVAKLYKNKLHRDYDELYIDFKFVNAYSQKKKF